MNTNDELKQEVWDYILNDVQHQRHGKNQLSVRCPYCGDSRTKRSTHMYVKIPFQSDEPMLYYCFLCNTSGIVNPDFLRGLGVSDLHLNGNLIRYNNEIRRTHRTMGASHNTVTSTVPMPDRTSKNNQLKKAYLEKRLGRIFTWEELHELRVVFDLGQYLEHNDIERITGKPERARMLQKDYVGFVTTYHEFIVFRKVNPEATGKRYEVYNIHPMLESTRKIYTIPADVDMMSTEPISINIAEGAITLLGVYYHIANEDRKHNLYVAALGSNFINPLQYFIQRGLIGKHITINIFSDSEHEPGFYRTLRKVMEPWVGAIELHYNTFSERADFGVPKNQITLSTSRIPRR